MAGYKFKILRITARDDLSQQHIPHLVSSILIAALIVNLTSLKLDRLLALKYMQEEY
jgi:hypothetical protein